MSTIRLYFDVDSMERAVIGGLRARGVDVMTAQEAGTTGWADSEHFAFAHTQSRVLFSFNASRSGPSRTRRGEEPGRVRSGFPRQASHRQHVMSWQVVILPEAEQDAVGFTMR